MTNLDLGTTLCYLRDSIFLISSKNVTPNVILHHPTTPSPPPHLFSQKGICCPPESPARGGGRLGLSWGKFVVKQTERAAKLRGKRRRCPLPQRLPLSRSYRSSTGRLVAPTIPAGRLIFPLPYFESPIYKQAAPPGRGGKGGGRSARSPLQAVGWFYLLGKTCARRPPPCRT